MSKNTNYTPISVHPKNGFIGNLATFYEILYDLLNRMICNLILDLLGRF